ncbi:odorant receptor 43a-like [Nilaparvata lugens]|uniref:odorant receptor 43a-like n=1 Tax=Nilaparvata lugens TaxID=108931 RepID=UPI00193D27F4|nr:odorant receptor 43a-like [Nilaparvata lugens]
MESEPTSSVIKFGTQLCQFFGVKVVKTRESHEPVRYKLLIVAFAGLLQIALAAGLSIQRWENVNTRVTAFTKIGEYSICTIVFFNLLNSPDHILYLLTIVNNPLTGSDTENPTNSRNLAVEHAKLIQKIYLSAGVTLWFFTNFIPVIIEIVILCSKNLDEISLDSLITCYYFIPYLNASTMPIYCVLSLVQTMVYSMLILLTSFYFSLLSSTIKMLEYEVINLTSNISSIDSEFKGDRPQNQLRSKLRESIRHHQKLIRAVSDFNKSAGLMLLAFNSIITGQLSLELYCTLETDEPMIHFLRMPGSVVCYGVLCSIGQSLINGGDNLCRVWEHFDWISKPGWFKKDHVFIVMCMKKPLQIKPANLYVLNSTNFMAVMQAAYSYLNMMRSFRVNRG